MKNILLPTDFSKNSWNAIRYALSLFRDSECAFFIINAFQVGSSGLTTKMGRANETRLYRLLREESERGLANTLKKMEAHGISPKHSIKTFSIADLLTNAVARTVNSKEIDLIVMGTKGATGLKEVFLGSNAHKIIREIHSCPIILVPDEFEVYECPDTLVLATGFEHLFNPQELKPIVEIGKLCDTKVWVTYVGEEASLTTQQQGVKEALDKQLDAVSHKFVFVDKVSSVNDTIQKMIEGNGDIHMVAMVNYWHSFFEKLTREPVIKKVSFNTAVPFMVVHLFD
ncbi:universal stress protein [Muricauda sp. JGD-17]|uniref:Universal stress protein n=1 Tax=Flagellimonas ochracea TaxID=2696472 RepID=A0A964TED8_9FLAO|nr:universal stress protein [Allomuricauda ochracea]NAY92418.1 universal stress protein [Allomuricauda ochracea]